MERTTPDGPVFFLHPALQSALMFSGAWALVRLRAMAVVLQRAPHDGLPARTHRGSPVPHPLLCAAVAAEGHEGTAGRRAHACVQVQAALG